MPRSTIGGTTVLALFAVLLWPTSANALGEPKYISTTPAQGDFVLAANGKTIPMVVSDSDWPGVVKAAGDLSEDVGRVTGHNSSVIKSDAPAADEVVLIGTIGKSPLIDSLIKRHKLDVSGITGHWESAVTMVVEHPMKGVRRALVIAGADKRGTIYGIYDLSEQIGVSPWYWWADVRVPHADALYVQPGRYVQPVPAVKYRGIFFNDEAPALSGWTKEKFGGMNHEFYTKVFELLLRLKANFLWPAMWNNAFAADDPENAKLADEYGIVMGTSHEEPMMRAEKEWVWGHHGAWDYATNQKEIDEFWRAGMERDKNYEEVVTLGMRGEGDTPMSATANTQLLKRIVADQREILKQTVNPDLKEIPQVWALYKEVQDYYDHGMKVPDDVILLFADDNWGQIRRLPEAGAERKGGYGIYYHFDYVGDPRNYKWINTNQIEKTWQQMDLAYASGARALWIVNVGDIKPMEFPLSFFMKQAWNPEAMTLDALNRYPEEWARETFGPMQASAIADLVTRYSQLAARRKPELIDAGSYRLGGSAGDRLDGGEFGAMIAEWQALEEEMRTVKATLPNDQRDAYFQLVEHPILALSNLYQLYYAVAWNRRLAEANDPRANVFADRAEAAFRRDQEITDAYHALNGGKWDGMMLQTHIGYTNWQEPARQVMPEVKRVASNGPAPPVVFLPVSASLRIARQSDVIAIEAPHYARAVGGKGLTWQTIPHLGRTLGAVTAFPQGRAPTTVQDGVHLEYDVTLKQHADLAVQLIMVPTLDPTGKDSLRIGLSVDGGAVQTLTDRLVPAPNKTTTQEQRDWNQAVEDNGRVLQASFPGIEAGKHVIKVWRLDDNAVLQKLVISNGSIPPTYLGPAETGPFHSN